MTDFRAEHHLATIDADGDLCDVIVRFSYDGLEHIGRLWFAGPAVNEKPIPDHGAIPGRTMEEAIQLAERFTTDDLLRRFYRARAEKRKYLQLRRATEQFLDEVKYLNRVTLSIKGGMLDEEGAKQEVELIKRQMHELVDKLPPLAGVEEPAG
ncbi:MAG: hypothetical protein ACR2GG_03035 [Gemmatimonadaceae bacterium]